MASPAFIKGIGLIGVEDPGDPLLGEIRRDLEGRSSPLELLSDYLLQARRSRRNDCPAYEKLAKLFEKGRAPERVEGLFYGVTLSIRSGNRQGFWRNHGNLLNVLWGLLLARHPPWVGKGFTLAGAAPRGRSRSEEPPAPVFAGINYFRRARTAFWTRVGIRVLKMVLGIRELPEDERRAYGCDHCGGHFVARRANSVTPGLEHKEVFQLDYRQRSLKNPLPLKLLIDEIVEIADGLYMGPLLFATKRLFRPYDPFLPSAEYGYANFGYFLLMDSRWDEERRRLFPYTEDTEVTEHRHIDWARTPKFTEFTFADPPTGRCDDQVLETVNTDLEGKETILDLLQFYAEQLGADPDVDSPYFAKLGEIFNRGVAPTQMSGYLHGAAVAFRNQECLRTFSLNTLNMLWPLARHFSPWVGKTFEEIDPARLQQLTDGFETGAVPTAWGANVYTSRTAKQKLTIEAMRLAKVDLEEASRQESRRHGYDWKSFFFIGRQGPSANPANGNKNVYQFNYRWPRLRTMPPDHYCIDELVQIAKGLYLGQLVYATQPLEKYDPNKPASIYNYRNFGYFLLMDDEWHTRKMEIQFDLIPSEE